MHVYTLNLVITPCPNQDKTSATAPALPKGVDEDDSEDRPEAKPTPEQLGEKVSSLNLFEPMLVEHCASVKHGTVTNFIYV